MKRNVGLKLAFFSTLCCTSSTIMNCLSYYSRLRSGLIIQFLKFNNHLHVSFPGIFLTVSKQEQRELVVVVEEVEEQARVAKVVREKGGG